MCHCVAVNCVCQEDGAVCQPATFVPLGVCDCDCVSVCYPVEFWCAVCECDGVSACCLCQCVVLCSALVCMGEVVCVHVIVVV